jgi:hypothetical protein
MYDDIENLEESPDSSFKKIIYQIPFDQMPKIAKLLEDLEKNFPYVYIDVEMTSLEEAYLNIAKAEELLH